MVEVVPKGISALYIGGAKADESRASWGLKEAAGEGGGRTNADFGGSCVFVGVILSLKSGTAFEVGMTSVSNAGTTLGFFLGENGPKPADRRRTRLAFFSALVKAPVFLALCDTFRGDFRGE